MKSLIAAFFCVAIASVHCSPFYGLAGPIDGGAVLKGPSQAATIAGPSGVVSGVADAGGVAVAPRAAGLVAPAVAPLAPALVSPIAPAVVAAPLPLLARAPWW